MQLQPYSTKQKGGRWKKKKPSFSHTQILYILRITPNTDWQPTPKILLFGKKVTFESLLFLSLGTKTSNITSCLMHPFLASILWTEHTFLCSFRALTAWLSTVTSFGVCRWFHNWWSMEDATHGSAELPSWQVCSTTTALNTRKVYKE